MKTNELMIGDYIRNKRTKDIVCVFEIDDDRNVINNEPDGYYSEKNIYIDDIEPIPITPEILEKNGWKYNNYNNETEYDEEYYVNEDGFDIHINCEKFEVRCIDSINIQLKYLHELQHALKLCGIEKTIEL